MMKLVALQLQRIFQKKCHERNWTVDHKKLLVEFFPLNNLYSDLSFKRDEFKDLQLREKVDLLVEIC
jgi:hypothetical protein